MVPKVDSYRFVEGISRRVMRHWAGFRALWPIPWTPLPKPLEECTIALVSSAALALSIDRPFDAEVERLDPWTSDASYRVLPAAAATGQIQVCHRHINPSFGLQDLDSVMPLPSLVQLAKIGEIGRPAASHYSFMGYTLRPERLLTETVPAISALMHQEQVDAVLLVPV